MSVLRWSVLGFGVGLLCALAPSCGTPVCSPSSCTGCCDAANVCHDGKAAAYCGVSGEACIGCGDNACIVGVCFRVSDAGLGGGYGGSYELSDAGDDDAGLGGGAGGGAGGGLADGGLDGGSDAGLATIDDFCARSIAAQCAYYARCGQAAGVAGCEDVFARSEWLRVCGLNEKAGVADGRTAFDPTHAQRCLDDWAQTAPCVDGAPLPGADCKAMYVGAVADGQPCFDDVDCAAASYCASTVTTCPATCAPKKAIGIAAVAPHECQDGLYVYQGKCAAYPAPNGSCAPIPSTSGVLQSCPAGYHCGTGNTCLAAQGVGALCPTGAECAGNLACVGGTCATYAGLGAVCRGVAATPPTPCQLDLHCDAPQYQGSGTCAAAVGLDAGCYDTSDCSSAFYCLGPVFAQADGGTTPGRCSPLEGTAGPCRTSTGLSVCQPGLVCGGAIPSQCGAAKGLNATCSDGQCGRGLRCDSTPACTPTQCFDPTP